MHSLGREIAVKHLRFLTVLQSPFLQFSSLAVHKSNLLRSREWPSGSEYTDGWCDRR
jgi:hypothetical protein